MSRKNCGDLLLDAIQRKGVPVGYATIMKLWEAIAERKLSKKGRHIMVNIINLGVRLGYLQRIEEGKFTVLPLPDKPTLSILDNKLASSPYSDTKLSKRSRKNKTAKNKTAKNKSAKNKSAKNKSAKNKSAKNKSAKNKSAKNKSAKNKEHSKNKTSVPDCNKKKPDKN